MEQLVELEQRRFVLEEELEKLNTSNASYQQ